MTRIDIDKSRDDEIKDLCEDKGRGALNMLRHHLDLADYLFQRFPMLQNNDYSNGMRLYWLMNGIEDFPDCKCTDHGIHKNKTSRCRFPSGYETEYCCASCASHEGALKGNLTRVKRYGSGNNFKKTQKTLLKLYGVSNISQRKDVIAKIKKKLKPKRKQIAAKTWDTRKKMSTEPFGRFSFTTKRFLQELSKSGLSDFEERDYSSEERRFMRLRLKQYAKLLKQSFKPLFSLDEWIQCKDPYEDSSLSWRCPEGHEFSDHFKTHYHEHLRCPICNPYLDIGKSNTESWMQDFIESQISCPCLKNDRKAIAPKELDLYIPSLNLAFEFDGLYSHSSQFKKKDYHLKKTEDCKKAGIKLIHVFEDEWNLHEEACKSMISNALGTTTCIDLSSLQVEILCIEDANIFFRENSLDVAVLKQNEIALGLVESDEIAFAVKATICKDSVVMRSPCSKIGFNIPNNAIDLIAEFAKSKFNIAYATLHLDRRWFNEDDAKRIFTLDSIKMSKPGFSWVSYGADNRHLQDQITQELLESLKTYDANKTVVQNLKSNKFMKIFDCGEIIARSKLA